jgi:hypothetical protein
MSVNGMKSNCFENRSRNHTSNRPTTAGRARPDSCNYSVTQEELDSALDSLKLMREHVKMQRIRIKEHDKLQQEKKLKAEEAKHQYFLNLYQQHRENLKKYREIIKKKPKIPKKNVLSWLEPERPRHPKTPDNGFFMTELQASTKSTITHKLTSMLHSPNTTKQSPFSEATRAGSALASPNKRCSSRRREKRSIMVVT